MTLSDDVKKALQSKTVLAGIGAALGGAASLFGYSVDAESQTQLIEGINQLVQVVGGIVSVGGGLLAVYGRIKATKKIGK